MSGSFGGGVFGGVCFLVKELRSEWLLVNKFLVVDVVDKLVKFFFGFDKVFPRVWVLESEFGLFEIFGDNFRFFLNLVFAFLKFFLLFLKLSLFFSPLRMEKLFFFFREIFFFVLLRILWVRFRVSVILIVYWILKSWRKVIVNTEHVIRAALFRSPSLIRVVLVNFIFNDSVFPVFLFFFTVFQFLPQMRRLKDRALRVLFSQILGNLAPVPIQIPDYPVQLFH